MNWIKFLRISRYLSILLFVIIYFGRKFDLIDNYFFTDMISLSDLSSMLVLAYFAFYIKESRLEIKLKNIEISSLKEQLENK
jgi:hypothetical protein